MRNLFLRNNPEGDEASEEELREALDLGGFDPDKVLGKNDK
ncbi:hypothetical protein [Spirillospora sp. CA-128828]